MSADKCVFKRLNSEGLTGTPAGEFMNGQSSDVDPMAARACGGCDLKVGQFAVALIAGLNADGDARLRAVNLPNICQDEAANAQPAIALPVGNESL
jgi:hypothetical protein